MVTKKVTFNCSPLAPRAIMALDEHLKANPNGAPLYGGKSRAKQYYGLYRIRETKTTVFIDKIGG